MCPTTQGHSSFTTQLSPSHQSEFVQLQFSFLETLIPEQTLQFTSGALDTNFSSGFTVDKAEISEKYCCHDI